MLNTQCVVSELFVYPIKGCRPTPVNEVEIDEFGVKGDRTFMVVKDQKLANLKNLPVLAKISTEQITPDHIRLSSGDADPIDHHRVNTGELSTVTLILDNVEVVDQGDEVANWISAVAGESVRLVAAVSHFKRNLPLGPLKLLAHDKPQDGFKDVSPIMVINSATLEDLNSRLAEPVSVRRFRPNIVVSGLKAYDEDKFTQLSHAQIEFTHVCPCERCVIVNADHEQGVTQGKEPLNALGKYRRIEGGYSSGIAFGSYFNTAGTGLLKVGDELEVT